MPSPDRSGFIKFVRHLPDQIIESEKFLKDVPYQKLRGDIQNIVHLGMGGSAIVGDMLKAYLKNQLNIPLEVHRNYGVPAYVNQNTLCIACSYSGNTEETLSATRAALERRAKILVIASGGKLQELAGENGLPFIQIPAGFPPRQALGYMFFPLLSSLQKLGLFTMPEKEISDTVKILKQLRRENDPDKSLGHCLTSQIARKLYHKIPLIYTAAELLAPVTVRWRNQFNENAKILSFSNVFPELNHNEIMGWEAPPALLEPFCVVLLRDRDESSRNKLRLEVTRKIMQDKNVPIFDVFTEGDPPLARLFSMIYLGDWISYHLALLYRKDPYVIKSIEFLKQKLSEIKDS